MAGRRSETSADVSQEELSELEDEIFLPYPQKGRLMPGNDLGPLNSASEWEELTLESEPLPQTGDHIEPNHRHHDDRLACLGSSVFDGELGSSLLQDETCRGLDGSDTEGFGASRNSGVGLRVRVSTLSLDSRDSDNSESLNSPTKLRRDSSILDGLLCEIYDRCQLNSRYSIDSDGFTEYSSNSEGAYLSSKGDSFQESARLPKATLNAKSINELQDMVRSLQHSVAVLSGRLIKQLKRRDRYVAKINKNQDVLTAVLQAVSQKRRVDARLKFSIEPLPGKRAFRQWYDALRAVARLPKGLPQEFRKSVWLSLANRHVKHLKLDWPKTVKFTFNDRSNPDDDTLGVQIVKDLHRTGCSGFCGQDAEDDRVVLKRVLLAYARWNKAVGYCQGFNVLAALILEVMERVEDDALKVMIFLIDHVLPDSYFANNLRALSVDMAVFRELLHFKLPELAQHLDKLQKITNDGLPGSYEPPLTNVFTMQWFLTLFATCLPKPLVLRVWDSIFLEGSEILLRVALAIWAKLGDKLMKVESADEFYSMMGYLGNKMLKGDIINGDELIQTIYSMAPFPFPHLNEIREKYMFSITPFAPLGSLPNKPEGSGDAKRGGGATAGGKSRSIKKEGGKSDEEGELDDDEMMLTCFTSLFPMPMSPSRARLEAGDKAEQSRASLNDITCVSPGAYGASISEDSLGQRLSTAMLERMNMDIYALKKQYWRIQRRQQQAHVIYSSTNQDDDRSRRHREPRRGLSTNLDSPSAVNHLLIGKYGLGKKGRKSAIRTSNNTETPSPSKTGEPTGADLKTPLQDGARTEETELELEKFVPELGDEDAERTVDDQEVELRGEDVVKEDFDEEDDITQRPVVEPPVGVLIDLGSPQHVARKSSQNYSKESVSNDNDHAVLEHGSAVPDERLTSIGTKETRVTGAECGKGNVGGVLLLESDKTKETAKISPLVQEHKFNFSLEAYRPEFGQHSVEGAGNPKMYGQSNAYRPWLHHANSNSESDSDYEETSQSTMTGTAPNKNSQCTTYNPFPTRRLKSERDRTRTRLKVGLYKSSDQGQENGLNPKSGRCINNQQLGSNSRGVKTGSRL